MKHQLKTINITCFCCNNCDDVIPVDGYVAVCPDCGAVYCKNCTEASALRDCDCHDKDC